LSFEPSSAALPAKDGRFHLLDLMRGIAAIAVLVYHAKDFLGVSLLPNAYLAVDLFFMLSGFVIAHSYDRKIRAGMSLREFCIHRVVRLYPCYLLALVLGFPLDLARLVRDNGYLDFLHVGIAAGANLFMLPSMVSVYGNTLMFPFNGPSWSLFFELLGNVAFWLLFSWLSRVRFGLLLLVSAIALLWVARSHGSVDVGIESRDLLLAVPRVMFSFFAGVAIRRYVYGVLSVRLGAAGIFLAVMLVVFAFSFSELVTGIPRFVAEFGIITVLFPFVIICMSGVKPGKRLAMLCSVVGDASYPVYVLQTPIMVVFLFLSKLIFHVKAYLLAPSIGVVVIVVTIAVAWMVDRYFELPARRWLKSRFLKA
jgi:peptidoglycan/LPS O-acetylase OafA/YrhL